MRRAACERDVTWRQERKGKWESGVQPGIIAFRVNLGVEGRKLAK